MVLLKCNFCKEEKESELYFYSYSPTKCKKCIYGNNRKNIKKDLEGTREYQRLYRQAYRKKMDTPAKLRKNVSRVIGRALSSGKNGKSCTQYLSYSFQDLKIHLESQFENWMNWDNYGIYDPKIWKDDDISTWTWSIDHIIPQSKFKYSSMEDESFKRCWALENLRPLSSKNNFFEGVKRTRH